MLLLLDGENEAGLDLNWKELSVSSFCGGGLEGRGG